MALYSSSFDEGRKLADLVVVEIDPRWCRKELIVVASDAALEIGTVLAKGQGTALAPYQQEIAPDDIADTPVAVLMHRVLASSEPQPCVCFVRGVTLTSNQLVWGNTVTAEQQQEAIARLEGLGIAVQEIN